MVLDSSDSVIIYIDSKANSSNIDSGHIFSNLVDGSHNITIYVFDLAGNFASKIILFTVDTTSPIINLSSPNAELLNYNSVPLTYNITEINKYITVLYLDSKANSSNWLSGTNFSDLSEGSHNITIVVTDIANHTVSLTHIFTIDTIKPAVNLLTLNYPNDSILNSVNVLNFSIKDLHLIHVYYEFNNNGTEFSFTNPYKIQFSPVNGNISLTIQAEDSASNWDNKTFIYTIDDTPPALSVSGLSNQKTISGGELIGINATDNIGIDHIEIELNNIVIKRLDSPPYSYQWDSTAVENGVYNITITAYDKANNNASESFQVTVSNNQSVSSNNYIIGSIILLAGLGLIFSAITVLRRRRQKQVNDNIDNLLESYSNDGKNKKI